MKRGGPNLAVLLPGAAIAVVAAVAASMSLAATSKPNDFTRRLAALQADTAEASRLMGGKRGLAGAPGSICPNADAAEAAKLQTLLVQIAQVAGLQNPTVEVKAAGSVPTASKLAALDLRVEGVGSYEAAMRTLAAMNEVRPSIFIETADLTSKTSAVSLTLEGRAFCSVL